MRAVIKERVPALAKAQAESLGAHAEVDFQNGFPPVINHVRETAFAREVARDTLGEDFVDPHLRPRTASEDFAYLLQARPGSFLFLGNGDSASLHNPRYDFNDAVLAPAAAYWAHLVERFLS